MRGRIVARRRIRIDTVFRGACQTTYIVADTTRDVHLLFGAGRQSFGQINSGNILRICLLGGIFAIVLWAIVAIRVYFDGIQKRVYGHRGHHLIEINGGHGGRAL